MTTAAEIVPAPQRLEAPYAVEYSFFGKASVKYQCPKCRSLQRRPVIDAGHQELCDQCGHTHTVPGMAEKQRRAEARAADISYKAIAKEKRQEATAQTLRNMAGITWSLWILRAMCVVIAMLSLASGAMWCIMSVKAANLVATARRSGRITQQMSDRYDEYKDSAEMFFIVGCSLVGFFATLLIGYAIASAIDRAGRARNQPQ